MTLHQFEHIIDYLTGISEAIISHREEIDALEKRIAKLEKNHDHKMQKSKDKSVDT